MGEPIEFIRKHEENLTLQINYQPDMIDHANVLSSYCIE